MESNQKIENQLDKITKSIEKLKKSQSKNSDYVDDGLLKKYFNKDVVDIDKELNSKQVDGLKSELKEAILLSIKLTNKNKELLFWKKFPFWVFFLMIIMISIFLSIREIVLKDIEIIKLDQSQLFVVFAMIALSLMIIFVLFIVVRYVRRSGEDINSENKSGHDRIKNSIETYLKPSVSIRIGLNSVIREATKVLEETETSKNPYIIYYGAPALSGLENDEDLYDYDGMTNEKSEEVVMLLKSYSQVKQNVNHANIKIERYIKILTREEFELRSPKLKKRYINWLEKQSLLLGEPSSKYKIYEAMRAPTWGSSQSYIITNSSYLHIIGQGNAVVHIKGEQIVEQIKSKMSDAIESAQKPENKPQPYLKEKLDNDIESFNKNKNQDIEQSLLNSIISQKAIIAEKENSIEHAEDRQKEVKKETLAVESTLDKKSRDLLKEEKILTRLINTKKVLECTGYESSVDDYFYTKLEEDCQNIILKLSDAGITKSEQLKELVSKLKELGITGKKQLENLNSCAGDIKKIKILLYDLLELEKNENQKKIEIINVLIGDL